MTRKLGTAKVRAMDTGLDPVVQQAIDAAGGTAALALGLGIQAPSIYSWRRVPAVRVLAVEALTGISRHELRPDIYPREPAPAPKRTKRPATEPAE